MKLQFAEKENFIREELFSIIIIFKILIEHILSTIII